MADLRDANRSRWYRMLTLLGEQPDATWPDYALQRKNAALWNRWVCADLPDEYRVELAKLAGEDPDVLRGDFSNIEDLYLARSSDSTHPSTLPSPQDIVDLRDLDFARPLDLSLFIFPAGLDLSGVKFTQPVTLNRTVIGGDLEMSKAVFERPLTMRRTKVKGTFNGMAVKFLAPAHFRRLETHDAFDMTGAQFTRDTEFDRFTATGHVSFERARFFERVTFLHARFGDDAIFKGVRFGGSTVFSHAKFEQFADFYNARFGTPDIPAKVLTFANATFHGPVSFESSRFPDRFPVLSGTTLHDTTTVTARDSHWPPEPKAVRQMFGLAPHRPTPPPLILSVAKASAAKFRHAMAQQNLPEEEHFFFRREMYAATRIGPRFPGWLTWFFFELPSNYGHSVERPAALLFVLWLAGWWTFTHEKALHSIEAAGYSFANMFKFFGLQRTYFNVADIRGWPEWIQWASATQTVFAFIFLFYLGLGLRTRFRLR